MSIREPMSIERAREITKSCVAHVTYHMTAREGETQTPLPDVSLEEMLEANRIVADSPAEEVQNQDGSTSRRIYIRCDPRIVAAHYALRAYGTPERLLEALGYSVRRHDEEDEES